MESSGLKAELQAITPEVMIEAVKHASWKLGGREQEGFNEEFTALKEDYPALGTAVELMVEADVVNGRSLEYGHLGNMGLRGSQAHHRHR